MQYCSVKVTHRIDMVVGDQVEFCSQDYGRQRQWEVQCSERVREKGMHCGWRCSAAWQRRIARGKQGSRR